MVVAPAHDGSVAHQLAGVIASGRDRDTRYGRKGSNRPRCTDDVGSRRVAGLPLAITSPALHRPSHQQPAGVIGTRSNSNHVGQVDHRLGVLVVLQLALGGAPSELAFIVPPPALDRAIHLQSTGVVGTGRDLGGAEPGDDGRVVIEGDLTGWSAPAAGARPARKHGARAWTGVQVEGSALLR